MTKTQTATPPRDHDYEKLLIRMWEDLFKLECTFEHTYDFLVLNLIDAAIQYHLDERDGL